MIADNVLRTARALFAERGFAATSMRQIGQAAGVDPAMVSYYFGSKVGVLEAALTLPSSFAEGIRAASTVPLERRGRAIVDAHLRAWEDQTIADTLRTVILAASQEKLAMDLLRQVYSSRFLDVVAAGVPEAESSTRAALVAAQMLGLAMTRYVWGVGAFAEMTPDQVGDAVSPLVQEALTGPLVRTVT